MYSKYIAAILVFLFIPASHSIASTSTKTLDLLDLYTISLNDNSNLKLDNLERLIKLEKWKQAKSLLLPSVSLAATYNYNDNQASRTNNSASDRRITNSSSESTDSSSTTVSTSSTAETTNKNVTSDTEATISLDATTSNDFSQEASVTSNSTTQTAGNATASSNTSSTILQTTTSNNDTVSLLMEWSLWDSERRNTKKLRLNEISEFSASTSYRKHRIAKQLSHAYFDFLYHNDVLSIYMDELNNLTKIQSILIKQHNHGVVPLSNVTSIEIQRIKKQALIEREKLKIFNDISNIDAILGSRLNGGLKLFTASTSKFLNLSKAHPYLWPNSIQSHAVDTINLQIETSLQTVALIKSKRKPKLSLSARYNFTDVVSKTHNSSRVNSNNTIQSTSNSTTSGTSVSSSSSTSTSNTSAPNSSNTNSSSTTSTENTSSSNNSTQIFNGTSTNSIAGNQQSNTTINEKYRVLFSLSVPIFNGGRIKSEIKEANLNYGKALIESDRIKYELNSLVSDFKRKHELYINEAKLYEFAITKQIDLNKKIISLYEAGFTSELDTLEDTSELFDIKLSYANSLNLYMKNLLTHIFTVHSDTESNIKFLTSYLSD